MQTKSFENIHKITKLGVFFDVVLKTRASCNCLWFEECNFYCSDQILIFRGCYKKMSAMVSKRLEQIQLSTTFRKYLQSISNRNWNGLQRISPASLQKKLHECGSRLEKQLVKKQEILIGVQLS